MYAIYSIRKIIFSVAFKTKVTTTEKYVTNRTFYKKNVHLQLPTFCLPPLNGP